MEIPNSKLGVTRPQWPQMSQHALRGHLLSLLKSVPGGALAVLFTCGLQRAFGMFIGIGG